MTIPLALGRWPAVAVAAFAASLASAQAPLPSLEVAKLTASRGTAVDIFGRSVAVGGGIVVVGAIADLGRGPGHGAAYVFAAAAPGWDEVAVLTASDGTASDGFGEYVAIDGDTIVVGAALPDSPTGIGAAYVFVRPATGWASATETAKLTPSNGRIGDLFGFCVAIGGDTVVVGAPLTDVAPVVDRGAVYVFVKPASGWADMTETAVLDTTVAAVRALGSSVSISGDTVVAGAPRTTIGGNVAQGAVLVFTKPAAGWSRTTERALLAASDGATNDRLSAASISGDAIAAGAAGADLGANVDQGAVYVFAEPASGWVSAVETGKLVASGGRARDTLGYVVALDGDTVVAGAPFADVGGNADQGAAYLFAKPASGWTSATEDGVLTASDGAALDQFGEAVAVGGGAVVVGAHHADVKGSPDAGAAYVFSAPAVLPGSGCGLSAAAASGSTRLGGTLQLSMARCAAGAAHAFLIGGPLTLPFPFAPSIACGGVSPCLLSCNPLLHLAGPGAALALPRSAAFAGVSFCVQGACVEPAGCLRTTDLIAVALSR